MGSRRQSAVAAVGNRKSAGRMPTMVSGVRSTVIARPMTAGSASNSERQSTSEINTPSLAPSSNSRPRIGRTSSMSKTPGVTFATVAVTTVGPASTRLESHLASSAASKAGLSRQARSTVGEMPMRRS
jgi:hypothetical protein